MSFLTDILQKTTTLFKSTGNTAVGIDIGTSSIKIVQIKRDGGKIKLETYGELSLGSYGNVEPGRIVTLEPEIIAKAIIDVLRESNVTTTSAVISIQSQATLVFVLELPHVSDSELASLIPNEARKYIPVPLGEVSLDWFAIPEKVTYTEDAATEGSVKKMEVVVVAVRNETLAQYKQISEKSNLSVTGNEIEVFSAIRSAFHREISPTLLVDYGASTTKVAVIEYGVVRAYHVINRGSAFSTDSLAHSMNLKFDKAEEMKRLVGISSTPENAEVADAILADTQYIIGEIQAVLLEYERSSHKAISKIILCGGGSSMPGFREKINEVFGVETVLANPFDKAEAPEFMRPVLERAGPEFTVAAGLALKDFI